MRRKWKRERYFNYICSMEKHEGKYYIHVEYTTGDSFGSQETYEDVDYGWNDFEIAAINAKAMAQHARIYEESEYSTKEKTENKCRGHWWLAKPENNYSIIDERIYLTLDNGDKVLYRCPWCGYFERFHSAEVRINEKQCKFTKYDNC